MWVPGPTCPGTAFTRHLELGPMARPFSYDEMPNAWGSQMQKRVKISRPPWIAVWTIAILLTVVGGISPAESWRFDIQLPGIGLALLLMAVAGPFALMFGASGRVFSWLR